MGANLQEWHLFVTDRSQGSGRAPMIDDDTGDVFLCTVDSTASPTIYSDASGTAVSKTNSKSMRTLTNGQTRFWTDRSVTNLDIYWFGSKSAGILKNAHFSRHELPVNLNGQTCVTAIPVGNTSVGSVSAVGNKSEGPFSTGVTPASNVTCLRAWAQIISAGENATSSVVALGTSGLSNAFFSINTSAVSSPGDRISAVGAYSLAYTFSGTEAITFGPSSETNSAFGALCYMELHYSPAPLD